MTSDFAPKLCVVCGAQAKGINFNAQTCISCKVFFRRNALCSLDDMIGCAFNDSCVISTLTRRFCSKCRLKKCFRVGMKKENIRSKIEKQRVKERLIAKSQRDNRQISQNQIQPQLYRTMSMESGSSYDSVQIVPTPEPSPAATAENDQFQQQQQTQQMGQQFASPKVIHNQFQPYQTYQNYTGCTIQEISSQSENSNFSSVSSQNSAEDYASQNSFTVPNPWIMNTHGTANCYEPTGSYQQMHSAPESFSSYHPHSANCAQQFDQCYPPAYEHHHHLFGNFSANSTSAQIEDGSSSSTNSSNFWKMPPCIPLLN